MDEKTPDVSHKIIHLVIDTFHQVGRNFWMKWCQKHCLFRVVSCLIEKNYTITEVFSSSIFWLLPYHYILSLEVEISYLLCESSAKYHGYLLFIDSIVNIIINVSGYLHSSNFYTRGFCWFGEIKIL